MTTAGSVIKLVLEAIDFDISNSEAMLKTAEEYQESYSEYSDGFYSGIAFECKRRIEALKLRRDYYVALDLKCAEEERQEEEENDQ